MNPIKIIKNDDEHQCALARLDALFDLDPAEGSEAADELELLAMLIEQYEVAHFPIDKPSPIEAIEFRMEQQSLKKKDMIEYFGSAPKVSEVLNGKRPLSLNMIRKLYQGLGIPAEILIQDTAMPANLNDDTDYSAFPLAEMRKRGYFEGFNGSLTELKEYASEQMHGLLSSVGLSVELLSANVNSSNGSPAMLMRTSAHQVDNDKQCDPYAQLAWQARVLQLARRTPIKNRYEEGTVTPEWMRDLAKLSSLQNGPALAVEFLNNAGIQLVFEAHLPKTYLDGAVCMNNRQQPVVALTLRHNRLDNFWFTLMHELAHIALHFESEERWFVDDLDSTSNDPREDQADTLAREVLIPASSIPDGLPGTDTNIKALASRLRITPSIIAGRIRRERSNYSIHKNFFGKAAEVRNLLKEEGLLN